jgi:hypothetical protein
VVSAAEDGRRQLRQAKKENQRAENGAGDLVGEKWVLHGSPDGRDFLD